MARCFGDITNIGCDHWSPRVANDSIATNVEQPDVVPMFETQDEEFIPATQDNEDNASTPSPGSGKRLARPVQGKGKKAKTGNALLIQEAVSSMASSANEFVAKKDGKYSIDQVMEIVIACGAGYETNEHYIASELFVKKGQREMFMTLPTNEIRFNWLRRKYNDKHAK